MLSSIEFDSVGCDKALLCPMVCQLRSADNLSKHMADLPEGYYTESMSALGIIQAPDLGEP